MTSDEYSTEMELYGVSPGVIAILMFTVTLLSPSGFVPERGFPWFSPVLYSLFWVYEFGPYGVPGFRLFNYDLIITLPLCILNVVYALWIVRHYQGKSSKYSAAMIGLLGVSLPTFLVLYFTGIFLSPWFIYPIPIQFIAGLLILWRIEGPEVISPWSGMRLDLSWWKQRRQKRKNDWVPFEDEKKVLETEEEVEPE